MLRIFAVVILLAAGFIIFMPREEFPKTFPQFQAVDFDGNIFTNKIFDGKLTAILLWTTDSEPCREVLKNLDADLPPNFQIIGLVGNKNFDAAQVKTFSKIPQLIVNDDFAQILTKIKFVPAVIFVDGHGNLINAQFVPNAKFIREELIRLSEKDSPKNFIQEKFW